MTINSPYDIKYTFKCLAWFLIVMTAMKFTEGAGFLIVVFMALFGLAARKTEQLLFWLLVATCMICVNNNFTSKGAAFAYSQRGLMVVLGICMSVKMISARVHPAIRPYGWIIPYLAFMCVPSFVGWDPIVSFLKLFLFTVVYFSYFGVANDVGVTSSVSAEKLRSIMLAVAILFIVGSVALVPFPELSQLRPEQYIGSGGAVNPMITSLFTGMANHSQSLGPVVSSISVLLFADMLFSIKRFDKLYTFMLLCCPYLIYKTSSRTGMGAYLLGMMFVAYCFMRSRGVGSRWKARVMSWMFIGFSLICAVFMLGGGAVATRKYLLKTHGENAELNYENVASSRQFLVDIEMENFKKKPFIGNGFQVSEMMVGLKRQSIGDYLTAPVEKGVWVTAVLEEGGVIGWTIFVAFLFHCIVSGVQKGCYIGASGLFVFTVINLGEFSFFSMSYSGGFSWAMIFFGLAFDIKRLEAAKNSAWPIARM